MIDATLLHKKNIYRIAAWSTITMLIIIPIQIIVFALSPHPDSVQGWLDLFGNNWLLGVIHLDGLYIINNIIIAIIYVALFLLMIEEQTTKMVFALLLGMLGISSYFASNKIVEMYFLSREYWSGLSALPNEVFLASAQNMLLEWKGTAFDIYYILNGIALFLISFAMFKSQFFKNSTAIIGLIASFFMIIPSNFGTVGLIFALISLIPWYVFAIMLTRVFFVHSKY